MKILLFFVIVTPSIYSQTDSTAPKSEYQFSPQIAGGQVEITSLLFILEYGGLIDFDLFQKKEIKKYSLGLRIAYEWFGYAEFGGSTDGAPYRDYSLYFRSTSSSEHFAFSLLAGLALHTRENSEYGADKTMIRLGFELKYKVWGDYTLLVLKGSTSLFNKRTSFGGIGIAFGLP